MDIDSTSGSMSIMERVAETIQTIGESPEGCSVDQIVFKLKGLYTESDIRQTVDTLQQEGVCYATIDNEHVKSCQP